MRHPDSPFFPLSTFVANYLDFILPKYVVLVEKLHALRPVLEGGDGLHTAYEFDAVSKAALQSGSNQVALYSSLNADDVWQEGLVLI